MGAVHADQRARGRRRRVVLRVVLGRLARAQRAFLELRGPAVVVVDPLTILRCGTLRRARLAGRGHGLGPTVTTQTHVRPVGTRRIYETHEVARARQICVKDLALGERACDL